MSAIRMSAALTLQRHTVKCLDQFLLRAAFGFFSTLCKYKYNNTNTTKMRIQIMNNKSTNRVERKVRRHETPSLAKFHFKPIKSSTILHANCKTLAPPSPPLPPLTITFVTTHSSR